jgi:7-cyano-7-deazaguanine reductase
MVPNAMTDLDASPLGRPATWATGYDPGLLFAVERAPLRAVLGPGPVPPFRGVDLWTAYELSWLDPQGKPRVAIATFSVPADSPCIVESKSVKLYLTAFNLTRFTSEDDVAATIARDLSMASGATVGVRLTPPEAFAALPRGELAGDCLDALPLACDDEAPVAEALVASGAVTGESVFTRLFRSVCPVTGQPDYASVAVRYHGKRIDQTGLLRYLVSFRRLPGFHEHCVERIFADVWRRCGPESLSVYARFTRRGGIDINPYRTSGDEDAPDNVRTARQ